MKLTLETYGKKYTIETTEDDLTIDEYLDIITGLLYQATFSEQTIQMAVKDLANTYKEE